MAFKHERARNIVESPQQRVGAVPDFKPRRDVNVPVISVVACPDCKAEVDSRCVGPDGITNKSTHRARRRMAVRLFNAQRASTA